MTSSSRFITTKRFTKLQPAKTNSLWPRWMVDTMMCMGLSKLTGQPTTYGSNLVWQELNYVCLWEQRWRVYRYFTIENVTLAHICLHYTSLFHYEGTETDEERDESALYLSFHYHTVVRRDRLFHHFLDNLLNHLFHDTNLLGLVVLYAAMRVASRIRKVVLKPLKRL